MRTGAGFRAAACGISDAAGKTTCDGAFVASLPLTPDNVAEIAACARARWKIENECFNALKNNGCDLELNFGRGKKHLDAIFAAMSLLAFAFHTACDCVETLWQQARTVIGARARFFQHLRIIPAYVLLPSWLALLHALTSGNARPTWNRCWKSSSSKWANESRKERPCQR